MSGSLDDRGGVHWWAGVVVCRACGNRQVSVIPIPADVDAPETDMECSGCGAMACHPESDEDIWDY